MTSKKRVETETDSPQDGSEPKRARGEEEGEESKAAEEPAQDRRGRSESRGWLSFPGRRHPRVGDEYQVTALPEPKEDPSSPNNAVAQEHSEGKEDSKED